MEITAQSLQETFRKYVNFAKQVIEESLQPVNDGSKIVLLKSKYDKLRDLVNNLEKSELLDHLAHETFLFTHTSSDEYHPFTEKYRVSSFFKKSYFYINVFQTDSIDEDALFNLYTDSIQKEDDFSILIPLEFCSFSTSLLEFDSFQIIKFTQEDLDIYLSNEVAQYFYPDKYINTDVLQHYHFIVMDMGSKSVYDLMGDQIYIINKILSRILLFDWQQPGNRPFFSIPFYFQISHSLMEYDIIFIDPEKNSQIYPDFKEDDIALHLTPDVLNEFDEEETDNFEKIIQQIDIELNEIADTPGWEFIEIALLYFAKAFWASNLTDKILCYVTALEALLGEKGESLTRKLANRISIVLGHGKKRNERKEIKSRFLNLYDIRSELVHGKKSLPVELEEEIRTGREYSRELIRWFVQYLFNIKGDFINDERMPIREEILLTIDIDPSSSPYIITLLKNRMKG